jgi:hypothetical protein
MVLSRHSSRFSSEVRPVQSNPAAPIDHPGNTVSTGGQRAPEADLSEGRSLVGQARNCLRDLWDRPASLLFTLLALNALFLPYRGWNHDALFYGLQVANRVEAGRFANDLFLRFGSQDNYSFFSLAATPLARAIGTPATFLLLYLATTVLFFWALIRLVRALVPDGVAATLGLLFLAVWMPPVGGLDLFHVNENFFTPRLLAHALVLVALERMLAGRWLPCLLLLTGGLLLHPLAGFGGLLLLVFWILFRCVPRRWLVGLVCVGIAGALTILLVRPIGLRLLGEMDPDWLAVVSIRCPHLFGSEWTPGDWVNVLVATFIILAAWPYFGGDRRTSAFLGALLAVTLLGSVGMLLVCWFPYALLIQGQPFRVLWLVQAMQVPLAVFLAGIWWARGRTGPRVAAVLLLGYLGGGGLPDGMELMLGLFLFLTLAQVLRITRSRWRADWVWPSLAGAVAGTAALRVAVSWVALLMRWEDLQAVPDIDSCLRGFVQVIDPGYRLLLGLAALLVIGRLTSFQRTFRFAALATFLVVQLLSAASHHVPGLRDRLDSYFRDVQFVRQFLDEQSQPQIGAATVYWPISRLDCLWFDLEVNSYFSWSQLSGVAFSRDTALEGRRRADLVASFELDLLQREQDALPAWRVRDMKRMFRADQHTDAPAASDLLKLCAEADLDYVVARQEFPGLYAATNGTWFIYDCRALRSRARVVLGP